MFIKIVSSIKLRPLSSFWRALELTEISNHSNWLFTVNYQNIGNCLIPLNVSHTSVLASGLVRGSTKLFFYRTNSIDIILFSSNWRTMLCLNLIWWLAIINFVLCPRNNCLAIIVKKYGCFWFTSQGYICEQISQLFSLQSNLFQSN